ncbi:MAG: hypothetical protein PHP69_06970 [Candidatus Omnitrophica bacterium]|nr:hypothetical protein [Candidatus Omnitrophota bacterium]MDD5081671.1 hypothetical protein [Candidatus Omnitrophota bacterium]
MKPFDLETGLYYSGNGVCYSPEVAVDVNTPAVYYSPEDYPEYEPSYEDYAGVLGEFDAFILFVAKQGVERSVSTQDFICEKIADRWEALPLAIRNYEHNDPWKDFVSNFGDYKHMVRLPFGYHVVVYNSREGVYVHQDVYNPLYISQVLGHINEWKYLKEGETSSIFVDKNSDINSGDKKGK